MNEPIDRNPAETDAAAESMLERRSRALFDQQVTNLDAATRSRLNQARQAALAATRGAARPATGWHSRWLLPVGSAAAFALVAVTTVNLMRPEADKPVAASTALASNVDEVEILTSDTELELLQNMDFYAWLETQPESAAATSTASEPG